MTGSGDRDTGYDRLPVEKEVHTPWMITFADLLSLMLTFFVLLYSMNTIEFRHWSSVVETMAHQFNPERAEVQPEPHPETPHIMVRRPAGMNLNYLQSLLADDVASEPLLADAYVTRVGARVSLVLPANRFFEDKTAELKPAAASAIARISTTLVYLRNRIVVAGHTNPTPVVRGRYRSNWELSLARARLVSGLLAENGYAAPLSAIGYGDSRFGSFAPSLLPAERYRLAERIEISIIAEGRESDFYDLF